MPAQPARPPTFMTAADIRAFMDASYGLIADLKMLDFFRALSSTAAFVIAVLVVCSILVKNPWCRYLCPYGALMGLLALASPARGALDLVGLRRRAIPGWAVAAGVAILFFGLVGYARVSGHWHTTLPAHTYFELIPNAARYGHPG
jgi:hypothetical protein